MLFVDRGFPIDVIFYARVWERRERKEERGERAHWFPFRCFSKAAISHQIPHGQRGSQGRTPGTHASDQAFPRPSPKPEPNSRGAGREAAESGQPVRQSLLSSTFPGGPKGLPGVCVALGETPTHARRGTTGTCKPSELGEGVVERLGSHSNSVQSGALRGKPNDVSWVPTWDVEMARRLLVGAGGRLAV